jgi:glycosyltransferase involved in cell wall biosynthesis
LAEALRWLSGLGLRRCAAVVAVGQCMREQLLRRGILPERLSVIPNWAVGTWRSNAPEYPPAPAAAQFRRDQGWENRFVVMYSGNFGRAHDFEPILDAAEEWERRAANIWLVLSGHGPRRAWMEKEVTRRGLGRVSWLAWQPAERLSASLGAADMHIASLREELCGLVVPSKVYGILGAGRPCLFLGPRESEVARLIERAGCGEVLSGANGARLAQCLVAWSRDPDRVEAAAGQSRRLRTELSGVVAARLFGEVLQRVRGEGPLLLQGFTPEPGRGEVGVNAGGVERERAA